MRTFSLILVAALTVMVAGAAFAGPNCESHKATADAAAASVENAKAEKAEGCSAAKMASAKKAEGCSTAKMASAEKAAACAAKKAELASAESDCPYCAFTGMLKQNAEQVTLSTVPSEKGLTVVFASVTENDIEVAQTVANKAFKMMNAPAHCAYTRAEMAKKSCDGCAEGLGAFADAEITLENIENGAQAVIIGKDEEHASELKAFFASNFEDAKTE